MFPQLEQWFFNQINIGAVTIDFDSTVITREGQQEVYLPVCSKGAKPRRHFVVRKRIECRPEALGELLFEDLPEYRYSSYVTNLELCLLLRSGTIYNGRADCENRIKELKQDFCLESFCLNLDSGF